jgi:hypothetical protein
MTNQAFIKAKVDVYNIISNHSMDDFRQANYNRQGKKYKKHVPYSLGDDTKAALELYTKIACLEVTEVTKEIEEEMKGFLLVYRTHRTEYLKEAGGTNYFKNSIEALNN